MARKADQFIKYTWLNRKNMDGLMRYEANLGASNFSFLFFFCFFVALRFWMTGKEERKIAAYEHEFSL